MCMQYACDTAQMKKLLDFQDHKFNVTASLMLETSYTVPWYFFRLHSEKIK